MVAVLLKDSFFCDMWGIKWQQIFHVLIYRFVLFLYLCCAYNVMIYRGVKAKKVLLYLYKLRPFSLSPLDMYNIKIGNRERTPLHLLYLRLMIKEKWNTDMFTNSLSCPFFFFNNVNSFIIIRRKGNFVWLYRQINKI